MFSEHRNFDHFDHDYAYHTRPLTSFRPITKRANKRAIRAGPDDKRAQDVAPIIHDRLEWTGRSAGVALATLLRMLMRLWCEHTRYIVHAPQSFDAFDT